MGWLGGAGWAAPPVIDRFLFSFLYFSFLFFLYVFYLIVSIFLLNMGLAPKLELYHIQLLQRV